MGVTELAYVLVLEASFCGFKSHLIPVIVWIVYCNVKATKQEFKDYKLTDEAEGAGYISNSDCGGSIQITDINEISI